MQQGLKLNASLTLKIWGIKTLGSSHEVVVFLHIYDKIPVKFIPFNENDDICDKFSIKNLINPTLVKFMHDGLKFQTHI